MMQTETFRPATLADVDDMLLVLQQAQRFMASQGLNQWAPGYPGKDLLLQDIAHGEAHVLCGADGKACATAALVLRGEPVYEQLRGGSWGTGTPYATLHRFALGNACRGGGAATRFLAYLQAVCAQNSLRFLRVDTHQNNQPMRRFLQKNGFTRRGVVYYQLEAEQPPAKRIAFDKTL